MNFLEKAGTTAIALPIALAVLAWQIFAFSIMWGWFVVPFGLPPLTFAWALGLGLTVGCFKRETWPEKAKHPWRNMALAVCGPALALAIGYLCQPVLP